MRILNRKDFLRCPAGTVFFDYRPQVFGGLSIKTCEPKPLNRNNGYPNDFFRIDIDTVLNVGEPGSGESCSDTYEAISLLKRAEDGERVDLHFDANGRDGVYDEDARFAVLDPEDVQRLIAILSKAPVDEEKSENDDL